MYDTIKWIIGGYQIEIKAAIFDIDSMELTHNNFNIAESGQELLDITNVVMVKPL